MLPKILVHDEALENLEKYDMKKACAALIADDPSITSNLYSSIDKAAYELETIALNELNSLKKGDLMRVKKIMRLQMAINELSKQTEVNFN